MMGIFGLLLLFVGVICTPIGVLLMIIDGIRNSKTIRKVAAWFMIIGGVSLLLGTVLCSSSW